MSDTVDDPNMKAPDGPQDVSEPLRRAIGARYLTYARSTIIHRAVPDSRDVLTRFHRRIVYEIRDLR
ncbi:MAG: hypothetical protein AB3N11_07855, partial [Arenibacterium sp.]